MTEALNTQSPYTVDFETLFSITRRGREWNLGMANFELIDEVKVAYFAEREVVVYTTIPLKDEPIIKMCLDDHYVPFDRIESKPGKKSTTK